MEIASPIESTGRDMYLTLILINDETIKQVQYLPLSLDLHKLHNCIVSS